MYVCMCMSDLCKLFRYFQKVRDCDTEKEREREREKERERETDMCSEMRMCVFSVCHAALSLIMCCGAL